MASTDEGARVEAWGLFWSFFDGFKDTLLSRMDYTTTDANTAAALLPQLIITRQREQPKTAKRKARR